MAEDIAPMTPGGQWLAEGGAGTPHYVVNPDHITRLLGQGYQIVPDPRTPGSPEVEPTPAKEKQEKPV